MTHATQSVEVLATAVGWTAPVLDAQGAQVMRLTPGRRTRRPRPQFKHHVAFAGDVVDIPVADVARLGAGVRVLDGSSVDPWAVGLALAFAPDQAIPATAPGALPADQGPATADQAPEATTAPDGPQEPAQDAEEYPIALGGGWYLQQDGTKTRGADK